MGIRTPTHVDTRNRGTRPRPLGHTENLTKKQPFLDNQFIVMTNDIVGCIKPPGFPMYISHCAEVRVGGAAGLYMTLGVV